MLYVLVIVGMLAFAFFLRWRLVVRAVRKTDAQLKEILRNVNENQILKQEEPCLETENLLITINDLLSAIRRERIAYAKRETEFQGEIENISHDLRTPLTSIIGYLKIMDKSKLGEEEKEDLKTIERKACFLQRLVTQFYDYARLVGDDFSIETQRLDLSRYLREMLMDSYQELEEKGLSVEIRIPEHAVFMNGDGNALERVFQNLLQNALRYAQSIVVIEMEERSGRAEIMFENDVKDLQDEELEHLFDRFYKKEKARSCGASGLGLTVAKELVEKMSGAMEAESAGTDRLRIWVRFDIGVV